MAWDFPGTGASALGLEQAVNNKQPAETARHETFKINRFNRGMRGNSSDFWGGRGIESRRPDSAFLRSGGVTGNFPGGAQPFPGVHAVSGKASAGCRHHGSPCRTGCCDTSCIHGPPARPPGHGVL